METETLQSEYQVDEQNHKKGRHRKKQLYNSILQQMEFYFSDSNLAKDRFLSQLIKENPYVDLNVFLKFNKIRKLTSSVEDIQKAVKHSTLIELSEDKNSICRKEPIKEKTNVDECTIYVEGLKSDANHDWVKSVFSEFGNVVYVSIPKYKYRNAIKGFAFVEFNTEIEAQNALNYFEGIGGKQLSTADPSQLCSVVTYEENNIEEEDGNTENKKKRKLDDCEEIKEVENISKKLKTEGDVPESDGDSKKKKKQHKKENKKKNYIKELGLQVLSKKEWKKMRNRYLDLQRKKMHEFKQHLHKAKFTQANNDNKLNKSDNSETKIEQSDKNQQKLDFIEGVIVKVKLSEPCADTKKLKNEIKTNHPQVKFIDIPPTSGNEEVFIRFSDNQFAKDFCSQGIPGEKEILKGDEEKAYWEKLMHDRETKFKKTAKKQRGRDKLQKKANKLMATHIKFDD